MTSIAPISVVIPAFNSQKFIGQAIESILDQSFKVDEIIVVNNNCTDRTVEIAKELGVKVVSETKQNLSAARNRGISVCRNDWIAFLDSDDLWEKEKIELQWRAIEKFPDAKMISCNSSMFSQTSEMNTPSLSLETPDEYLEAVKINDETYLYCRKAHADYFIILRINASSVIVHREVFSAVGVFDEELLHVEAVEFFMRAMAKFSMATIQKDLTRIRHHEQNRTHNTDSVDKYYVQTTEKIAASPDKYPSGALDYFRELVRLRFTAKGIRISGQTR